MRRGYAQAVVGVCRRQRNRSLRPPSPDCIAAMHQSAGRRASVAAWLAAVRVRSACGVACAVRVCARARGVKVGAAMGVFHAAYADAGSPRLQPAAAMRIRSSSSVMPSSAPLADARSSLTSADSLGNGTSACSCRLHGAACADARGEVTGRPRHRNAQDNDKIRHAALSPMTSNDALYRLACGADASRCPDEARRAKDAALPELYHFATPAHGRYSPMVRHAAEASRPRACHGFTRCHIYADVIMFDAPCARCKFQKVICHIHSPPSGMLARPWFVACRQQAATTRGCAVQK